MKKNTSIIVDISDEEVGFFQKQYISCADIQELIEELTIEREKMDMRKKKAYKEWKEKINFLMDLYNARVEFSAYKKIKK